MINSRGEEISVKPASAVYQAHINSPEWSLFKSQIFEARGRKCEFCPKKKKLHVHHNTYTRFGYELPEDVTVLCVNHHMKVHKIERSRHVPIWEATQILRSKLVKS